MTISKNSIRIQFTLNSSKDKERKIIKFLDGCLNPNVAIKEIIFNYIVSQSDDKLVKVSNIDNNIVSDSDNKLVEVSNCEEKHEVSELEQNELDELSKFL